MIKNVGLIIDQLHSKFMSFLICFFVFITVSSISQPLFNERSEVIYLFFLKINGLFCHQNEDRSIYIFGDALGVCSRCISFYFTAVMVYFSPIVLNNIKKINLSQLYYFILISPLALDGITQLLMLRESNNTLRIVTGFLAGIAVSLRLLSHKSTEEASL